MLANLSSTGDIHVSLPIQPQLIITAAAAHALRPSMRGRTDTSGLATTASGLLNTSGSGALRPNPEYGGVGGVGPDGSSPGLAAGQSGRGTADIGPAMHGISPAGWQADPRDRSVAGRRAARMAAAGASAGGGGGGGPGRKASTRLSMSRESTLENEKAVDKIVSDLKEETARLGLERKFRRVSYTAVWLWLAVLAWIAGWSIAAVWLAGDDADIELLHLYDWRWCIVAACVPVVWWLPHQLMFLLVLLLEAHQSTGESKSRLVYYLMGIRTHMVALLRMLLALIVIHYVVAKGMDEQYSGLWEHIFVKIWICEFMYKRVIMSLLPNLEPEHQSQPCYSCASSPTPATRPCHAAGGSLFCFGNVLKTIIARSLSKHFHTKVRASRILLQPIQ